MEPVYVRAAYGYDSDGASLAAGKDFEGTVSLTQQQFADESDINTIVRRFGLTGEMPENLRMPTSGDFNGISDFQDAMNIVVQSQEEFLRVPADVRERFSNDPGRLMAFLENPDNRDEALKLGLLRPPVEKTRDAVVAIDELAARLVPLPSRDVPGSK